MQSIPLPNKVYFDSDDRNRAVLVMEPLYPGYGVTIGNALRRVLLSSLPGAAVTSVKIKGVDHEFSTVKGVREDIVDMILNLKQLNLKVFSDQPVKLELKVKGPKEVKASDISENSDVEIVNKDLLIATLDSGADLHMELDVRQGRGYVPVEMREEDKSEIGVIAIDAIYSPIKNVNYEIQNVRVGQITNYDRLTLTMETDGTIGGKEAIDIASKILVDHFSLLLTNKVGDFDAAPEKEAEEEAAGESIETTPLETVVEDGDLAILNLSNRAANALERNGIRSVARLKAMTRQQLENLEGLGKKSIDEILETVAKYNEAS